MKKVFVFMLMSMLFCCISACTKEPVKVLIITGQNTAHNWQESHVLLQKFLNESGMFQADVVVSPKRGDDMSSFILDFTPYQAVVIDYDGDSWPETTNAAFLDYVKNGGGVVIYHAANNSFPNWKEYNEIIGLGGWGGRNEKDGPYVYFKENKEVRDDSPGRGGAHGRQHEFVIDLRDKEHPITKGLPDSWTHAKDELYDRLRGPAQNLTVLATAFCDSITGGTHRDEPILMTITYGKGRIFHTVLGHVSKEPGHPAVNCPSFIVTFLRGTEWAATGKVTQKVPENFPNK